MDRPPREEQPSNKRNQPFSDIRPPENSAPKPPASVPETDDEDDEKIIDLYADFNEDVKLKSDKELAELKRLAQMDALRAYGFVRRSIALMRLRLNRIFSFFKRRHVKVAVVCLVLVAGAGIGVKAFWPENNDTSVLGLEDTDMAFRPLLPAGNHSSISARSYDEELDVFSFQHRVGEQSVTVAQQLLPQSIVEREDGLAQVAGSLGAESAYSSFSTQKGEVYTSMTREGGQITVFSNNNLLIFINSLEAIDQEQLIAYINELQQ